MVHEKSKDHPDIKKQLSDALSNSTVIFRLDLDIYWCYSENGKIKIEKSREENEYIIKYEVESFLCDSTMYLNEECHCEEIHESETIYYRMRLDKNEFIRFLEKCYEEMIRKEFIILTNTTKIREIINWISRGS